MDTVLNFFFLLVLFVFSGFFSGSETALFSLSRIEKRRLEERHPRLARWTLNHLARPRRTLITLLTGNMIVNTLAASAATLLALDLWGPKGLGAALAVFTVLLILFGEITPKILAVRNNEALALLVSIPLEFFAVLFFPLRRLTRLITDRILGWLIPEKKEHPDQISEEELKALVKIGEEEGVLDRQERHMIQKIFEFGERPVRSIMTPRTDMAALKRDDPAARHMELIRKYHFSHFPVYDTTADQMVGVVPVQEYMLSPARELAPLLRPPYFVPATKRIDDLLTEFRKRGESFAVCVDEYGGTAGIVTLEDILEEIFGEFYDEYAKVENPIRPLGPQEFLVDAKVSLSDFNDYFSTHLKAREASTLAGFILEKLGELPEKGKVLKTPEGDFRVHEMVRQRILTVAVRPRA